MNEQNHKRRTGSNLIGQEVRLEAVVAIFTKTARKSVQENAEKAKTHTEGGHTS